MNIDAITQFILTLTPAITSVMGIIVALVVGVNKIKRSNKETKDEVKELTKADKELKQELKTVHKENVELKKQLIEITARMKHMYFVEKPEE